MAVLIRLSRAPEGLPVAFGRLLRAFLTPGDTLWWMTGGTLFQPYADTPGGHIIVVLGNAAFWLLIAALAALAWRVVSVVVRRLRR